eukprot:scaffold637367_cov47-Prasinocladus_malaysianus.AAC.1
MPAELIPRRIIIDRSVHEVVQIPQTRMQLTRVGDLAAPFHSWLSSHAVRTVNNRTQGGVTASDHRFYPRLCWPARRRRLT